MKDIMQKLAELEATAPKVTKKKMLNEDSTTPPMNVSNKIASLKDMFEALSENVVSGQKPIPVLDPQNKQAGMGFVTSNNPAVQNMLKALDPKDVQIVQAPGQQQATAAGQPAPAGATGQPQMGQMQMKEKDEGKPGKNFAKIAKSAGERYGSKEAGERVAGAVRAKLAKQGKLEEVDMGQAEKGMRKSTPHTGGYNVVDKAGKVISTHKGQRDAMQAALKNDDYSVKAIKEGAKVDRMVKHIEKSEKKLGKSKDEAEDIAWATANKRGMLDNKNKKKVKEGDIPSSSGVDTRGAGLGAGRSATTLEGKKPDFLDLDKDGNKKEPMKKAAADKNKKKVKESMNHRISAARLEGKSHGLRGHAHSGKRYEDMSEMKAYHEGYKEGLDECYGQGVYETATVVGGMGGGRFEPVAATVSAPATPAATVGGMADDAMEEGKLGKAALALGGAAALATGAGIGKNVYDYHKTDSSGYSQADVDKMMGTDSRRSAYDREQERRGNYRFEEDEMEEGNAFTAALAKTPKGGKFAVGGKTFTDRTGYDAKVNEYAFESLDQQLNALLNESEEVSEGLSVSISKGQQNSPDSVTITAQDAEAEHLLAFVKNAGLGLFGDDTTDTHSSAMSVQPSHGAPDEVGAGGIDIGVVDGHDGMMGLMQKLSGIQSHGAEDYADEEGDEEQLYGNHETADKKDCGCDGDCECSDYDKPSNEATCNECGTYEGMHEAGCSMGRGKEMVDEVESEDQMEFEVAEDNAPDSGEAESTADEDAEAQEDAALAKAGSKGGTYTVNEDGDEASEEDPESKEGEGDEGAETVSESFANLFRKLSFIAEESTEKEDDKAEKAGKKVAKDIEHDEGHKGKDDDKAEKAGKKVTKDIEYDDKKDKKEKVDEWANNAGPGKTVSDTTFEQDIDFMTKVIAGGLNKPKSTGQTTIPVITGQDDRMHDSPMDWATLAGIKK